MIRTIARYGVRAVPGSAKAALHAVAAGQGVRGTAIHDFEHSFAEYHNVRHAISTSYGRMAFYYTLRAMNLKPGSEIIFPALTFWVVPEIARVCGLKPVFVDIDSRTFNMDPHKVQQAITSNTCAIVPTHLYGQPCEMDAIMSIASKHSLFVVEDCAHALGATYRGSKTGTFGHAAFFSFQMLKGLNTYGGGMAITNDDALAERIRLDGQKETEPRQIDVVKKIVFGEIQRALISPYGFTFSMFAAFYIASFFGNHDLSRYLWEKIRPLKPLPDSYRKRYSNAQAIIGLRALAELDKMNEKSRDHAAQLTRSLSDIDSIVPPFSPPDTVPVYYQYCIRASDPATLSHRAIRRGVDLEIMHVDICNKLELFAAHVSNCPVAESTEGTLQLPVYSGLQKKEVDRVIRVIRDSTRDFSPFGFPSYV